MNNKITTNTLRYSDQGNVHMDFHGATNTAIDFIIKKYGIETMNDIFKKVGNDVYADIKEHINAGNINMLAEHWQHFFDREGADYSISVKEDEIILTVNKCTAYEHVRKLVGNVSPHFCDHIHKTNCIKETVANKHLITSSRAKAITQVARTLCQPWDFYPS